MSLVVKEEDFAPEDVKMEGAQPVDVKHKDAEPDVKKPDVKVKVKKEEKVKKEPNMFVKEEVKKEKKKKRPLEDLIPLPKTALTAPKRRGKLKYDFGSLIKSYPWREKPENSDAKTIGREARRLLDLLGEPPSRELAALEMDLNVSNIRELEVHELVQKVIDEQLEKEDLLGAYGDERAPIIRSRMGAYDYDSPPPSDMEQEASAPSSSSREKKEEPSSSSTQVQKEPSQVKEELKEEKEEAQERASLPSYKELALQRWKKCSKLRTGMLLLECPDAEEWGKHCRKNAVHGNPQKRALNRILAKYTSEYPQTQEGETECVRPDLSAVPDTVKLVQSDEMIFTVAVYDKHQGIKQEYDILGSQSLHDLRDAFYFVSDWTYDGQRRMNSGCMFIDGVFYSDMRSEHSVDYAPYLIEHLQGSETKVREPKSRCMSIRLCELERIPYGEKCCYVRQGDIEHNMYFTGVRLFSMANDCPFYDSYPVCLFMTTFQKRFCASCAQNLAVWVVHGAARLPVDPMHFCCLCFDRFFKDKQGQLIKPADYNVFPYLHDWPQTSIFAFAHHDFLIFYWAAIPNSCLAAKVWQQSRTLLLLRFFDMLWLWEYAVIICRQKPWAVRSCMCVSSKYARCWTRFVWACDHCVCVRSWDCLRICCPA